MNDIISKEKFKKSMERLEAAFIKEPPQETVKLYYEKLNYISEVDFKKAIEFIIDNDHFFPSIARLKEVLPEPELKQESVEELCS